MAIVSASFYHPRDWLVSLARLVTSPTEQIVEPQQQQLKLTRRLPQQAKDVVAIADKVSPQLNG